MISVLYDGGGTSNALQVAADLDAVIALGTQPTSIATGNHTGIELFLSAADDDKTPVVVCINHTASTITLSTIVHIQEDSVSMADMAFKVDRSVWELTAGTDHEPKRLVYFPCAPNSYVSVVLQSADTSTWYARYRLTQMHTAASGGVGAAEGDAATAGKQDTIITALQLIDDAGHGSATGSTQRTVLSVDADLDKETQSKSHTHTTAGTAESIVGDAAFSAGATVMVVGLDTWVAVGSSAAQAQGGDIKFPAGVPFTVQLDGTEVTFHLDAATSGEVSIHQVS
ncbi:hypothetical protein CMI37_36950 [Candidatus Pacearchaeota archaeon]|nr:hypothetical protein [Candidatus Pacearchaeota archaeon]